MGWDVVRRSRGGGEASAAGDEVKEWRRRWMLRIWVVRENRNIDRNMNVKVEGEGVEGVECW